MQGPDRCAGPFDPGHRASGVLLHITSHNSLYQCVSSFVGNVLLMSPGLLIDDGLRQPDECAGVFSPTAVDYGIVIRFKHVMINAACTRFRAGVRRALTPDYAEFRHERGAWLEDCALRRELSALVVARLKEYARKKGVRLIRDLPFFVSADSSDMFRDDAAQPPGTVDVAVWEMARLAWSPGQVEGNWRWRARSA